MTLAADRSPPMARKRWIEHWWELRDRLIRNPRFQRFAAAFVLTRPVARKRQSELFDLVGGFVYSQILYAIVKLDVLQTIANQPLAAAELAMRLKLPLLSAERLFEGAVALRLLNHRGAGRYGLGDLGAALLGNPGVCAMVLHHAVLYEDLKDPVALLRDPGAPTALSAYWAYASTHQPGALADDRVADYSGLMAISQGFIAGEVLDAYPVRRHRVMMDLGGGEGAFVKAAAAKSPLTRFMLFDLPAVAARANQAFAEAGLGSRAVAHGGDLFATPLPQGADLVTLIRVLYDHEHARAMAILHAARAALPAGGTLLVAESMAGTRGAERVGAAYFGMYLLAMKGGKSRSAAELLAMIEEAGFSSARQIRTHSPLLTGVIVARA